jgi:membrane protease subunit HflK
VAVQLQDVHPPDEVIDAFKDVASAREDKSRFINEAEAYRNDLLPKARGEAATIINAAQGYKESTILRAKGEAARFNEVLAEYRKAKDVTRRRLYIETMEKVFANPNLEKVIMTDKASGRVVPYLPLDRLSGGRAKEGAN